MGASATASSKPSHFPVDWPRSPLVQAFLLVSQQRRQQVRDHPLRAGFDLRGYSHAWAERDLLAFDLHAGAVEREVCSVNQLVTRGLAGTVRCRGFLVGCRRLVTID